jgi:serine/threonine protein kinase
MGEVYLAQDPVLGRPVALKVLQRQEEDLLVRFEQEACAASALNHPNILTIYEFGTQDGVRFIASEYIEGTSLRECLRRSGGALPLADVVKIGLQAATALTAAHQAGIIHRDIKPENLMVRPDGYVKVLDFGLAKRTMDLGPLADARTVLASISGVVMGTVVYMSPEQARGSPVDARADVWSLGCVLYEMVTGRAPFDGTSVFDILAAVLDREPAPIASARPDCPPTLVALIDRMLLKDREARVQSMADVTSELQHIARSLEAGPGHQSTSVQASQTVRSPRIASLKPVLLLAAVVLVVAIAAVFWNRFAGIPGSGNEPRSGNVVRGTAGGDVSVNTRTLQFWLTIQRVRDGKNYEVEFQSSGREIFENGWKFRLHASSPEPGYLYVINEGPDQGNRTTYHVLFPDPAVNNGSAEVAAATTTNSPWYRLDENRGTERLWLVSAAKPVPQLEQVKSVVNPIDRGLVRRPEHVQSLRQLLTDKQALETQVTKDDERDRTIVTGPASLFFHLLKLEHR